MLYVYIHIYTCYYMYVSIILIRFWFDSLSLQTFSVVRSNYSNPEIFKLKEAPFTVITPLPSVPQLSLKAEVKDISFLPVLRNRSKAGRKISLHCLKKTRHFIQPPLSKFLVLSHRNRNDLFSRFY